MFDTDPFNPKEVFFKPDWKKIKMYAGFYGLLVTSGLLLLLEVPMTWLSSKTKALRSKIKSIIKSIPLSVDSGNTGKHSKEVDVGPQGVAHDDIKGKSDDLIDSDDKLSEVCSELSTPDTQINDQIDFIRVSGVERHSLKDSPESTEEKPITIGDLIGKQVALKTNYEDKLDFLDAMAQNPAIPLKKSVRKNI